jgi:hypothetical protein
MSGSVERFVTISPGYVRLFGKSGEPISAQVSIIQEKKYPFRILGPNENKKGNVFYRISEIETPGQSGYLVTFENLKKSKGRYFDIVSLKTDSPLRPEIKITVHGYISD